MVGAGGPGWGRLFSHEFCSRCMKAPAVVHGTLVL